jgi:hypothetical protein
MIRVKGHYRQGRIDLDQPINVPEDASVDVTVQAISDLPDDWRELGMERLEQEWDNERDAIYDDWRRLYGVPKS